MKLGIYTAVVCLGLYACSVALDRRSLRASSEWRVAAAVGVVLALTGFVGIVWDAL
jgi:hypothetical protein